MRYGIKEDVKDDQTSEDQEPLYDSTIFEQKIFVIISGHASLYVEELYQKRIEYITRTLFPGDSIGDGPLSLDAKPGQKFTLITQTECDVIFIDKNYFKDILITEFTMISDLKDKMKALKN